MDFEGLRGPFGQLDRGLGMPRDLVVVLGCCWWLSEDLCRGSLGCSQALKRVSRTMRFIGFSCGLLGCCDGWISSGFLVW